MKKQKRKKKQKQIRHNVRNWKKNSGMFFFVVSSENHFRDNINVSWSLRKLYEAISIEKQNLRFFHFFRASSLSVLAFGNCLGYSWTYSGRARVANTHKVGLPKDETIVMFKQFSTEPIFVTRDQISRGPTRGRR